MSNRVMSILSQIISDLEIYSIDEAFLDLKDFNHVNLYELCLMIRKRILKETGIPVSIGVGRTKTLSKIANHIAKKNSNHKGVFILSQKQENSILETVPVNQIWGVGRKINIFLNRCKIKNAKQLKNKDLVWVRTSMTIVGEKMVKELRGEQCFSIENSPVDKKSICTSRTFGHMVDSLKDLSSSIAMYTTRCAEKLRAQNSYANFAHVFIQTNPFRTHLKQYTKTEIVKFPVATNDTGEMIAAILKSLKKIYKAGYQYKKAGVILSGIVQKEGVQENLFDTKARFKNEMIGQTVDKINSKMGQDVVRYAALGYKKKWQLKQQRLSPCYTTRWSDILTINI
tara:strand:- start:51 stop:1073 length:1023 start_codon:yes stop_codon:yes gene_type:complete